MAPKMASRERGADDKTPFVAAVSNATEGQPREAGQCLSAVELGQFNVIGQEMPVCRRPMKS